MNQPTSQQEQNISVCFRYISDGEAIEAFFCLQQVKSTDSQDDVGRHFIFNLGQRTQNPSV